MEALGWILLASVVALLVLAVFLDWLWHRLRRRRRSELHQLYGRRTEGGHTLAHVYHDFDESLAASRKRRNNDIPWQR